MRRAIWILLLIGACREVRVEDGDAQASDGPTASSTSSGAASSGAGGVAPTGDVFDPREVYVFGAIQSIQGQLGLVHWSEPSRVMTGFDASYDSSSAWIRPSDGRLVYVNTNELGPREFVCDDCPYEAPYPSAPLANDPVVPVISCLPDDRWAPRFLLAPDGAMLLHCSAPGGLWYDARGAVAFDDPGDDLVHLGYDGLALTEHGAMADLSTMTSAPIVGWQPSFVFVTARADPGGGFLAVWEDGDEATRDEAPQLWSIDPAGIATEIGTYPPGPGGLSNPSSRRIDAEGALFETGTSGDLSNSVVLRRRITGESDVVYDYGSAEVLPASLVTGP